MVDIGVSYIRRRPLRSDTRTHTRPQLPPQRSTHQITHGYRRSHPHKKHLNPHNPKSHAQNQHRTHHNMPTLPKHQTPNNQHHTTYTQVANAQRSQNSKIDSAPPQPHHTNHQALLHSQTHLRHFHPNQTKIIRHNVRQIRHSPRSTQ